MLDERESPISVVISSNLKQSCTQVADDEDGGHGCMASLQQVDRIQEEEMTWDYKDEQDSGRFGVHIYGNKT